MSGPTIGALRLPFDEALRYFRWVLPRGSVGLAEVTVNVESATEVKQVVGKPRFTASVFANILVVVAILCIPLMYGGTLTSAYQDPVERISHIKAAVVNEDRPYKAHLISGETETVDVGEMLTDALTHPTGDEDTGFSWTAMNRSVAERDLKDASIRAILYIPAGLSEEVAQIGTGQAPQATAGHLELVTDDGVNYLAGTLARSVAATLQDRVTSEASAIYAQALLGALGEVRTGMGTAADGAGQVVDGSVTLADGLHQLDEGAQTAADGSHALEAGADQLSEGLGQLAGQVPALKSGVDELDNGAAALHAGAASLNAGLNQYTAGVDQVRAGADTLRAQTPKLQKGIADLTDGSATLKAGAEQLATGFEQLSGPVEKFEEVPGEIKRIFAEITKHVEGLYERCVEDLGEDDLICYVIGKVEEHQEAIEGAADGLLDKAQEAIDGVAAAQDGMYQLEDGSKQINAGLQDLQTSVGATGDNAASQTVLGAINAIDDGLITLSGNSGALRDGASQLSAGSAQLAAGTGELRGKVPTLVDGVGQLNQGGQALAEGTVTLSEGLGTLAGGLNEASTGSDALVDGSEQLHEGIVDGQQQIPNYTAAEAEKIAQTSAKLLQVEPVREHAVNNSGGGFAPMFISLALWVGGIAIFLVLPALDRRPGPGETWWLAALRPARTAALFAAGQAALAVLLTDWLVELHAAKVWEMVGIAILASLTFVAVNQACIAVLGYRGRFVSIALLLLQIASMGATFPIETMPAFFNWIHPWLPMTYTQLSFRALIAGSGVPGIIGQTVLVLLLWLVVSFGFVLLAAYTRTKNHPLPYDAALLPDNYPEEDKISPAALAARKDLKKEMVEGGHLIAKGIVAGHAGTMGTVGPRTMTVTLPKGSSAAAESGQQGA